MGYSKTGCVQSIGLNHQKVALPILEYYLNHPVPPLLILTGPKGTAKLEAAHEFVQRHLCQVGTGCGQCSDCRLFLQTTGEAHPDFIQFPAEKVAIGDTTKPQPFTIRWLLSTRLPFAPFRAKMRFVLFPAAELILHEAETALLKTLEEPPDHTRFIFIANSTESLKETILSRGVQVPFHHIPLKALQADAGIASVDDVELLGGSFEFLDLIASEPFQILKTMVDDALSHPIGFTDLEFYVREEAKRSAQMVSIDYNYGDFLTIFCMLLLQKTRRAESAASIAESVTKFLTGVRMNQGGMLPFHLSRFFFELYEALFNRS